MTNNRNSSTPYVSNSKHKVYDNKQNYTTHTIHRNDCLNSLLNFGLILDNITLDGRFHNTAVLDHNPKKRAGWYIGQEIALSNKTIVFCTYGDFREGVSHTFSSYSESTSQLTNEDREKFQQAIAVNQKLVDAEKASTHAKAAKVAQAEFNKLSDTGTSDYLARKQVEGHGVKYGQGFIAVPAYGSGGVLRGIQKIFNNGDKRFTTGAEIKGSFNILGEISDGEAIQFAEGYSTAATIYQATNKPTVVCFNAGNLEPVIAEFRAKYPNNKFIICADNDQFNEINTGLVKATASATKHNCLVVSPTFTDLSTKPTDFNDLLILGGDVAGQLIVLDDAEIFNTLHKEGNATPLINLCGDLVGYWADDEASFKDNKVTGHFKLAGKPRAWIAPAQHAAHLNNVTGETVYACPRGIDADNVASHLKQEGVSFSIYDPNQSPEWHLFAMRSGTGFIFTADTKLSKKYAIKPSKAESEQSIFIDRNTMQADKKGGYLVARGVAGKYQNYLLGGSLEPAANAIIGYRKRYYQIRFKTLHDDVLAIGNPAIAKKSNYIDSVIIPEKLRDQVAYYDSLPIVQLTAETLKLSGVFVLDQIEGSGKSSKVAEILAHYLKRVLAITNTEALTGELADNLSCANYKDKAAIMSSRHNNRVAVCLNSLINQIIADFCNGIDVLIIDEIMSVLDALATGTHITESQRKPLYNALVGLIRDTPVVIIADANINQAVIDFIKSIRTDIYKAEFDFKLYKKPNAIFYNTEAQVIESAINRIKTAKDCVTIFTDSQAHARKIAEACCTSGQAIDDIALLHGENKGDYSVGFWRDIQTGLINYKALVASPVIGAGISLRENVDTEAFFIFTGHLNIPAYLQQLARNRSAENVHIHFDDSSDYDAHSCSSLDLLKSIKDATALDQYYLRSTQIAKELSGNKLEFLLRAMEGKGYSLSWANVEESTLDLKEISIAVKEQRVLAIQTAPNDAIVDTARKQILSNNSRATQAESNELIRFRIADMFLEDPDIDTAGKIDILPVAFNILRNLEIIRTPLSELKSLDQEDGAINSRKRNYVVTRDFLRLLGRAEQSPSRTVCKNIVLELIREQARYQSLISANMNFWKSNIDTLDCLAAVSRLCEKYLGFSIRRDEPGQYAIFYKYDLRAVDKRRAKNSYSLLINTPEKHAKKDEIFLNIFIKKLNFVKGSTPDNKRLVMPLVEKDNAIIYSTNNESHNPILETGDRISILNKLNPKQKVA